MKDFTQVGSVPENWGELLTKYEVRHIETWGGEHVSAVRVRNKILAELSHGGHCTTCSRIAKKLGLKNPDKPECRMNPHQVREVI